MASTRADPPPVAAAVALAGGGFLVLGSDMLAAGGLAPLLWAAAIAVVAAWPHLDAPRAHASVPGGTAAWRRTLIPVVLGASIAAWAPHPGFALAICLPAVAVGSGGSTGIRTAARIATGLAVAAAVGTALLDVVPTSPTTTPWTLLVPRWGGAGTWWPHATVLGVVAAWSLRALPPAYEATRRVQAGTWTAVGLAVLCWTGVAWAAGMAYGTRGAEALGAQPGAAWLALGVALASLPADRQGRAGIPTEMAAWAGLLTLAGPDTVRWVWAAGLPVALAAHAAATSGPTLRSRLYALGWAIALVSAAVMGSPNLPAQVLPAAATAGVVVAIVWVGATRAVREVAT